MTESVMLQITDKRVINGWRDEVFRNIILGRIRNQKMY